MRSAVPITVLVLALAGTAAAQPGVTPPISAPPQPGLPPPSPLPPPQAAPQGEELSETTALVLSLGGTVASWTLVGVAASMDSSQNRTAANIAALGLVGTMFAPSFGHWYARSFLSRGLGLRAAGVSTELLALMVLVVEGVTRQDKPRLAEGIAIAGAALYVAGTVDDIVTAPGSARRENQRRQSLMIVPMVRPDSAGVMLTGRF